MLGQAAVAMWWDISPEMKTEFEDWHTHEHMPERLAIPGFLRGTRWIAESGEPSYFILYETSGLATLTTGPYLERLNNPTPWSRKMMPHHLNMVRSLCVLRAGWGGGLPHTLATIRLSERSADLPKRKGLTGVHLLESQPMAGAPQTTEQKIRGGDRTADWVMLVGGYDREVVKAVAGASMLYRPAFSLTAHEKP
ncbi:MAG TPA: hypothetical protein VM140_12515 [Burkholderiales bacterium]|nr:hypothetical protein [Burkholderiales bacterium]